MTAFLFVPATVGHGATRRLDLAKVASLFAEAEEPARRGGEKRALLRAAATVLLLLLAIGDTVLVARPDALACGPIVAPVSARPTM